jgi:hypothetical protein
LLTDTAQAGIEDEEVRGVHGGAPAAYAALPNTRRKIVSTCLK